MPLWTDIIDPVEATALARFEIEEYEATHGSLARWLPNVEVTDDYVEFYVDAEGFVSPAQYRALTAPPEVGGGGGGELRMIKLPSMSRNEPIDEKTQKALKRLPEDRVKKSLESAIKRNVWAIIDRNEIQRANVINTGKVFSTQTNYTFEDNFERAAALAVTTGAAGYWSDKAVDRLTQLIGYADVYAANNRGTRPGALLMSRSAFSAFAVGSQFATSLVGGSTRPGTMDEVNQYVTSQGLPAIYVYERQTKLGLILPANKVFYLPAPGEVTASDPTPLGATYWGETLTADADGFSLEAAEQPGIVAGVYREDRIPWTVEAMVDACSLPIAHNANAAMSIQVLA